ncbi:MAG: hypothetical protein H7839_07825 [Magnetococcus sp. YQC-5]
MKIIKFFVIFGAVAIMMGLGVLFFKMYNKHGTVEKPPKEAIPIEETLVIPAGARVTHVVGMDSHGVATLLELPDGGGQLLFFSVRGQLQRRINLTPGSQVPHSVSRSPGN